MSDFGSMMIIFIVTALFILFIFAIIRSLFPGKNYEHVVGISLIILSILTIVISIFLIGGWAGMGVGFIAALIFGGTVFAMIIDVMIKFVSRR